MKAPRLPLLPALLLCFLLAPAAGHAQAEEAQAASRISIPDAGLSLLAAPGWGIVQHGPAIVKFQKAGASLWFYEADGKAKDMANHLRRAADQAAREDPEAKAPEPKAWKVEGASSATQLWFDQSGRTRFHAVIARKEGAGFHVEADLPSTATETRKVLTAMLASVDVRPFAHPARLVDWTLGCTVDAARGWIVQQDKDGRIKIRPDQGRGTLSISLQAETVAAATPKTRMEGLLQAGRRRLGERAHLIQFALAGEPEAFSLGAGTRGWRAPFTVSMEGSVRMRGYLHVMGRFTVSTVWESGDEATQTRVAALAKSFRMGTHPGPLKQVEKPAIPK